MLEAQSELALACAREMRSSGSKPDVGAPAQEWRLVGAEENESIPAFMRLSALKLHYADASFISRLGLTEREVAVLEQIRAARPPDLAKTRAVGQRPTAVTIMTIIVFCAYL